MTRKLSPSKLKELFKLFKGSRRYLTFALGFVLVGAILQSLLPLILRELIDRAIPSKEISKILSTSSLYFLITASQAFINYIEYYIVGIIGIRIVSSLKVKLFDHIFHLPMSFFGKHSTGQILSRVESDSQKLLSLFSNVIINLAYAFLTLLIIFIIMWKESAEISFAIMIGILIYLPFVLCAFLIFRPLHRKGRTIQAQVTSFLNEHIRSAPLLKRINGLKWSLSKADQINKTRYDFGIKLTVIDQFFHVVLTLIPQIGIGVLLYYAVGAVAEKTLTIGTTIMFVQYIHAIIDPLFMASEQFAEIQRAVGAGEKILEIMATPKEESHSITAGSKDLDHNHGFTLRNVTFGYDEKRFIIRDLSCEIPLHKTTAILGPTGGGKTTLLALLARFYRKQSGSIAFNNIDIDSIPLSDYRNKISYILQEPYLFPGSVLVNLKSMKNSIDDQKVWNALRSLDLLDFINSLPEGINTIISSHSSNLSSGEKQLIAMARSFIQDPDIILMDEATSALDPHTEKLIQQGIQKLLKNRTSIIVAHRISTIADADQVLILKDGSIVEAGNPETLLAQKGAYWTLYQAQLAQI